MNKPKILIVDDKPANLLALGGLLADLDVELVEANSGADALAHTLDHDFALVLLDVQMPDMDGYEVAELMRGNSKTRHIPIIFVTAAYKRETQIFKGYESGAVDYLFKPLEPLVFKSKVGVFLDLYRHKEELDEKRRELDRKLIELEELQQQLEETNEQLLYLSVTDGLTGLSNKRHFEEVYNEEWARNMRNNTPLSLLLLDIDHFKAYNDTYGHGAGDDCLRRISLTLSEIIQRDVDKLARIGGEEFAILLPGTDTPGAEYVAHKLLLAVSTKDLPHGASCTADYVTVSIGIASTIPDKSLSPRTMFDAADKALYCAKEEGRNRVCVSSQFSVDTGTYIPEELSRTA